MSGGSDVEPEARRAPACSSSSSSSTHGGRTFVALQPALASFHFKLNNRAVPAALGGTQGHFAVQIPPHTFSASYPLHACSLALQHNSLAMLLHAVTPGDERKTAGPLEVRSARAAAN